jgi:hypothetical protein
VFSSWIINEFLNEGIKTRGNGELLQ